MTTTANPDWASSINQFMDLRLCPHVNASGGFIEDDHLDFFHQPAGKQDFLLIPTAQIFDFMP